MGIHLGRFELIFEAKQLGSPFLRQSQTIDTAFAFEKKVLPTRWTLFTKNAFWLLFMIKWCEKVTAAESVEEEGAHASSPRLEHEEWADRR